MLQTMAETKTGLDEMETPTASTLVDEDFPVSHARSQPNMSTYSTINLPPQKNSCQIYGLHNHKALKCYQGFDNALLVQGFT